MAGMQAGIGPFLGSSCWRMAADRLIGTVMTVGGVAGW